MGSTGHAGLNGRHDTSAFVEADEQREAAIAICLTHRISAFVTLAAPTFDRRHRRNPRLIRKRRFSIFPTEDARHSVLWLQDPGS